MAITTNMSIGAVAALVALAHVTMPGRADHERRVNQIIDSLQDQQVRNGSVLGWLAVKGADLMRDGHFEEGLLSSRYEVQIVGHVVARCTGVLGVVSCRPPNDG